ncbi:hypothetical protein [Nitratireductor pacificus]|uniref:hypothetical protein n=1 Tax=Nitratireductor pacificus TaxID=1231180 RepID=UPI0012F6A564|nr:hypothetical protein [Nitratireductor pacificus]
MLALIARLAATLGVPRWGAGAITAMATIIAAGGLLWGLYAAIKGRGADEVRIEIERKDHEAGSAASEARDRLRRCLERGGLPDERTGQCDR